MESNSTPNDPTANSATQTGRNQIKINPSSLNDAVEALETANINLYELVIDYLSVHSPSANAELVQKFLYDWVIKTDFTIDENRKALHSTFRLIGFLNELAEKAYEVEFFTNLVKETKEVSHV
ncbi:hypothetical protein GCM10028818_33240 [Spirosoma horti]